MRKHFVEALTIEAGHLCDLCHLVRLRYIAECQKENGIAPFLIVLKSGAEILSSVRGIAQALQ